MSLNNYPYFIHSLYKNTIKEKNFSIKFFLLTDLFHSFLKLIYFLINKKYVNPNKDLLKELKKTISLENNLFKEIMVFLISNIKELDEINDLISKSLKKIDKNLDKENILGNESYFEEQYNKVFELLKNILLQVNKLINFDILIPINLKDNSLICIDIKGDSIKLKEIINDFDFTIKKLNKQNSLIIKFKDIKEPLFIKLISNNKISKTLDSKEIESLINDLSFNISGTNLFRIKLSNKKNYLVSKDIKNDNDIYIKREHVLEKLSKFVTTKDSGYLFIVGALGTGKSTLLNAFEEENTNYIFYKTNIEKTNYKKNIKEILSKFNSNNLSIENSQDLLRFFHSIKKKEKQIIIFEDIHLIDKIHDFLSIFPQKLPENIYLFFSMAARESIILPMLENRELYYIPSFNYNETKTLVTRILNYKNIFYNQDIEDIVKQTYGFPLFIKIYLEQDDYFLNKRFNLERKFINLIEQFEDFTIRYDKKLKNYAKYFFTLLSISKEGFTKDEIISILPAISNILIENYIDKSSNYLVKVNSRYKLSSYVFEEVCTSYLCEKNDLNFLHNKIIEFYEPWDKKVNSLSLKYLPYHYLELGKIDKVKNLMLSSFTKSKFKLYPKETLSDLFSVISQISKNKGELYEVFNFSFIHQRLKDTEKRDFLHILDLVEEGYFSEIINKSFSLNKSFERFLQLLIISSLAIDNKKFLESRLAIKKMISLPNTYINSNNSEIVFKISSDILSQGVFDIINLPRNRDDGVNIIKNLRETEYSYKVIEIILKLLEGLSNEIDKSVMLEALLNKIIDFESFIIIEKFYKDIVLIIDKIKNENIRDRLYHVYILCILKKSEIYNTFLDNLLEIKEKINTSLFKYLFYNSLSVLFIKLKQEKISYDFIVKSISFIEELDNLSHIPFMLSNLIFTLKNFEKTYFYNEIIQKTFDLIGDISFSYEGIQSQLNLINDILEPNLYKKEIKHIIEQIIKFNFDDRKSSNNFSFTKSYINALFKIKDKRTFNSLYKKILKKIDNKSDINKINIYLSILEYTNDENVFNSLKILINNNENIEKKISQIIENITNKNIYSSEISDIIMTLILSLDKKSDLSHILKYVIHNMDKKNISPAEKFSENIYNICNDIESVKDKVKVLIHLAYFLINSNQKESGLQLIRRIFSIILPEDDEIKLDIIKESLENVSNIKDSFHLYYCFSDILVNIYNISHYIKDDNVTVQIAEEVFRNSTKLNFSDLKNIFYRTLEIANKTVNANTKMKIINLVRKYLTHVSEKNFVIDILQKSILISEENFSENDLKLMSIASLGYINRTYDDIDRGKLLFNRFINDISFSSYEEYISEAIIHISKFIHKIEDKDEAISLYKSLIENDVYINNEFYLFNAYSSIIINLTKIADINKIYTLYALLIKISIRIENPHYKSEYLIRLVSSITNFKITRQTLELIHKIFNLSYFIKDERELSNFYKAFIISINKSLNMYPINDLDIFDEKIKFYLKAMEKSIDDSIKTSSIKAEIFSLLGLSYYKFDKTKEEKTDFFKKSINLIKEIQDNESKIGIETLTALRIIASKDLKQGNKILQNIVNSINKQKEDKEKFNLFEIFVSYKNHIAKSENYKLYIEDMIKGELEFKSSIFKNKMYIFAFNYYYQNKDIDNTYLYIDKAEKSLHDDESYDATEQKINLAINLININQFNKGNDILISVIENIKNKPKRILYELIIKIFNQISLLNKNKYKPVVIESIISQIDVLDLREISENDLYTLSNSYSNIKDINNFSKTLNYINNYIQKERLIDIFIDKLSFDEDYDNLLKLLPLTLFSVKLTDKIIASIILLIDDKDKIKILNENLLI